MAIPCFSKRREIRGVSVKGKLPQGSAGSPVWAFLSNSSKPWGLLFAGPGFY